MPTYVAYPIQMNWIDWFTIESVSISFRKENGWCPLAIYCLKRRSYSLYSNNSSSLDFHILFCIVAFWVGGRRRMPNFLDILGSKWRMLVNTLVIICSFSHQIVLSLFVLRSMSDICILLGFSVVLEILLLNNLLR